MHPKSFEQALFWKINMALEPDVQSSGSAARRIDSSVFRDGERARNNDIFIAVMGLTGSGKSSFISHLTKSTVEIGDKLQSCWLMFPSLDSEIITLACNQLNLCRYERSHCLPLRVQRCHQCIPSRHSRI